MQVEVLRRLRHGGQQFVRVEHVHVNDGGQAVIGNVKTAGSSASGCTSPKQASPGRMIGRLLRPRSAGLHAYGRHGDTCQADSGFGTEQRIASFGSAAARLMRTLRCR